MDNAIGFGMLGNDVTHAGDVGDPHRVELVDSPHDRSTGVVTGTLHWNQDGTFAFTPKPDYEGTIQFSYQVNDGYNTYGPAKVTIDVREGLSLPTISAIPDQAIREESPTAVVPFRVNTTNAAILVLQAAKYLPDHPPVGRRAIGTVTACSTSLT